MDTTTQLFSILAILAALLLTALFSRRRRTAFSLRQIAAYEVMPTFVGRAIESDRPLHISLGSAGVGGSQTILAVASAELAYAMLQRAAVSDISPIVTLSETSALPLGQDTLRRAYQSRNLLERYRPSNVRWYPAGGRSLAFAAAITVAMGDDALGANILVGSYGPELALIMESSTRRDAPVIAVSDQLEGQAVAFALSDEALIGEEVFAAGSYLKGDISQTAESAAIDALRWLVVIIILIGFILGILEG
ncbi:MAG: hypothetical protein OHK0046_13890 [Anaerolineae bacterium]